VKGGCAVAGGAGEGGERGFILTLLAALVALRRPRLRARQG